MSERGLSPVPPLERCLLLFARLSSDWIWRGSGGGNGEWAVLKAFSTMGRPDNEAVTHFVALFSHLWSFLERC